MALPDNIEKDLGRIQECLTLLGAFDTYKEEVDRANALNNLQAKIKHLQAQEVHRLTVTNKDEAGDLEALDARSAAAERFRDMIEPLQSELDDFIATVVEKGAPATDLMGKLSWVNEQVGKILTEVTIKVAIVDLAESIKRVAEGTKGTDIDTDELWEAIDVVLK